LEGYLVIPKYELFHNKNYLHYVIEITAILRHAVDPFEHQSDWLKSSITLLPKNRFSLSKKQPIPSMTPVIKVDTLVFTSNLDKKYRTAAIQLISTKLINQNSIFSFSPPY
jgi:hypothetical protein